MYTDSKIVKSLFYIQLTSSFPVVVGHFTASAMYFTEPFWLTALNQISRCGTVLLTIATGYLTAYSFDKKKPGFREYFNEKLIYIFIPFLVSGVLYHYLLKKEMPHTCVDFANILLGKTGDHLYFVFMICQYYVFAYLFRNIITIFLFHSAFLILFKEFLFDFFGEVSWVFTNTWYSLVYLFLIYVCSGLFCHPAR